MVVMTAMMISVGTVVMGESSGDGDERGAVTITTVPRLFMAVVTTWHHHLSIKIATLTIATTISGVIAIITIITVIIGHKIPIRAPNTFDIRIFMYFFEDTKSQRFHERSDCRSIFKWKTDFKIKLRS